MYDINENYNFVKELGSGWLGKTWLVTKIDAEADDEDGQSNAK